MTGADAYKAVIPKVLKLGKEKKSVGKMQSRKTAAQLSFEKVKKQRVCIFLTKQMDRINRMAEKSHKEKVNDFNKYLESLPEHYDIPKVGPG